MTHLAIFSALIGSSPLARAERPRVDVAEEGTQPSGFPAVSADGREIAAIEYFEASSDASLTAVVFLRVADGAQTERFVVESRDDDGRLSTDFDDGRGRTTWRRARNLSLRLRDAGFRTMEPVGDPDAIERAPGAPLVGGGLRVTQRRDRVRVRSDRDGHARWTGRLAPTRAFCGMSDERPRSVIPAVISAWAGRGVVLLEVGHVYASCMCPNDVAYRVARLDP